MIPFFIVSDSRNVYDNQALEEYLFDNVEDDQVILYMWQNDNTVVIGKNQNAYKECNLAAMEERQINLARRISGGGAVFHDKGNLNFTFIAHKRNYDTKRQFEIIIAALSRFGINAEMRGRNDLLVDGRKISGSAFCRRGDRCLHHGTILMSSDLDILTEVLNVDKQKLILKGVDSVRSRVANLNEFDPYITAVRIITDLIVLFGATIKGRVSELAMPSDNQLKPYRDRFSSEEWIMGRNFDSDLAAYKRFHWGEIDCRVKLNEGIIADAIIYSDALNEQLIAAVTKSLIGRNFETSEPLLPLQTDTDNSLLHDIGGFLLAENFTVIEKSVESLPDETEEAEEIEQIEEISDQGVGE